MTTRQQRGHKAAAFLMDSMHTRQMTGMRKVAPTKLCRPTLWGPGSACRVPEILGRRAGRGKKTWRIYCYHIQGGRTDLEMGCVDKIGDHRWVLKGVVLRLLAIHAMRDGTGVWGLQVLWTRGGFGSYLENCAIMD